MATVTELRDILTNLEVPNRGIEEPLSAPDLFSKKLTRFQDELYNLHQDSHLFRFLLALCGEGGAGSLKKEILYSKLQSTLAATHFHDLDRLYGDPLALPRLSTEIYKFDPKDETLTQAQWTEVYAKDANYRNRCLIWMRAIIWGTSIMGMKLAAEAACGVECDIFAVADYNNDQRRQPPLGIVNLGQTVSDGEFVIVPRINALTQAEKHRIIAMVDRIRPVDTLVTISLGNTVRTQKFPASVSATSEFSQVLRYVTGRKDIDWPDIGGVASINYITNGGFESGSTTPWVTTAGFFLNSGGTLSTLISSSDALEGSRIARVVCDGISTNQGASFPGITVIAGQTYTFSVFLKKDAGGANLQLCIGNNSTFGGMNNVTTAALTDVPISGGAGGYKQYSVTFTAAVTGLAICAVRTTSAAATTFYMDAAQMEQQPSPTPYIPTNGSIGIRSYEPNEGRWIESGIEKEAPTYAWISRQEAATFLDITNVSSSSEHYGDFSKTQQQLFAPLSFASGDQFYINADDFAYTQAFSQISLSIPWQQNGQVLVNNYYPLEYLQAVDLSQFNVSPSHRFWASREDVAGVSEYVKFDFGRNRPVNYIDLEITQKPINITVETAGEYLSQTNFDTGIAPWTKGIYSSSGTSVISWDSEFGHNKNGSLKFVADGTAFFQGTEYQVNPLPAGTYTGSVWVFGDGGQYIVGIAGPGLAEGVSTGVITIPVGWNLITLPTFTTTGSTGTATFLITTSSPRTSTTWIDEPSIQTAWEEATPTEGTDYTYGISYVVSEQPWRFWRLYFDKVDARFVRLTFDRRDDLFPFGNSEAFPWSVDVRNFRAVHLMQSSDDFESDSGTDILGNAYRNVLSTSPAGLAIDGQNLTFWQSQPNPTPIAVEALYFDVSTGTHLVTMSELDAGLGGGGASMSDYDILPMSAMESYVGDAGAQIVDEIFIDPVFSGCDMHFYWSVDPQPDWESKLWHPIPVHYKCTRGFHAFPYPVTCRYFKVEFSNLTPVPYNTIDYPQLLPPLYRKFPTWVQNYFSALTPEQLNPFIEQTSTITVDPYSLYKIERDILATTRDQSTLPTSEPAPNDSNEISDLVDEIINLGDETLQIGQEDQIRFFPPTIWRDDLKNVLDLSRAASRMIWQDEEDQYMIEETPEILDAPSEQSATNLSADAAQKNAPIMWFPRICRHGYQIVTGPFQSQIAYQVAIREVSFWYRGFIDAAGAEYGISTYGETFYGP